MQVRIRVLYLTRMLLQLIFVTIVDLFRSPRCGPIIFIPSVYAHFSLPLYLVLDKEAAWTQILELPSFGSGNSRANSLFWTASRPPPVPGFNSSALIEANRKEPLVKSSCASNSACDAIGTTSHINHILGLDKFCVHLVYFSC